MRKMYLSLSNKFPNMNYDQLASKLGISVESLRAKIALLEKDGIEATVPRIQDLMAQQRQLMALRWQAMDQRQQRLFQAGLRYGPVIAAIKLNVEESEIRDLLAYADPEYTA